MSYNGVYVGAEVLKMFAVVSSVLPAVVTGSEDGNELI